MPIRSYQRSEERSPFRIVLQHDLIGMQGQVQLRGEEVPQTRDQSAQVIPARMDDIEIIHITSVMTALQRPFHILVQHIEVNIAES